MLNAGAEDAPECGAYLLSIDAVQALHPLTSAEPCALQGVLEPGAEEELQLTVWINGGSEGTAQLVAGTQVWAARVWLSCMGVRARVAAREVLKCWLALGWRQLFCG